MSSTSLQNVRRSLKAIACLVAIASLGLVSTHWYLRSHQSSHSGTTAAADKAAARKALAQLPMSFEPNVGQTVPAVKYVARGKNYNVFLTDHEAVINLKKAGSAEPKVVSVDFVGGQLAASEPAERQKGYTNYYIGPRSQWHEKVPTYGSVRFAGVYKGIDTIFQGEEGNLRYDYVVHPGTDPNVIRLAFHGIESAKLQKNGELELEAGLTQRKPFIYQEINGRKRDVSGGYKMLASNQVGFEIGSYDKSRELIIDPAIPITYGSYLGGANVDTANAVTFDAAHIYVVGSTNSVAFPSGVAGSKPGSSSVDAYVIGLPRAGGAGTFGFRTFFGGGGTDIARAVGLASDGALVAVVAGDSTLDTGAHGFNGVTTLSPSAVTSTPGPISGPVPTGGGTNAWMLVVNIINGQMDPVGSTFVGSGGGHTTFGNAVVTFPGPDDVFIGGTTNDTNIGTTAGQSTQESFQGGASDGYIVKYTLTGFGNPSTLQGATYVGGVGADTLTGLALEPGPPFEAVIATGTTYSDATSGFPVTTGAFQTLNAGCPVGGACSPTVASTTSDAYVVEINGGLPTAVGLRGAQLFGTFIGGTGNETATAITYDPILTSGGNFYISGTTTSATYGTSTVHAFKNPLAVTLSGALPFVAKVSASGASSPWATVFGTNGDTASAIAVDNLNQAYVVGSTSLMSLNATSASTRPNPLTIDYPEGFNVYVLRLTPPGTGVNYLGFDGFAGPDYGNGVALDGVGGFNPGTLYFVGSANDNNIITSANGYQGAYQGAGDGFISALLYNDIWLQAAPGTSTFSAVVTSGAVTTPIPAIVANFTNVIPTTGQITISSTANCAGTIFDNVCYTGTPADPTLPAQPAWLSNVAGTAASSPTYTTSALNVGLATSATTIAPGSYTAQFLMTGPFDNSPQLVTINLSVTSAITVWPGDYYRTFTKGTSVINGLGSSPNNNAICCGLISEQFEVATNPNAQHYSATIVAPAASGTNNLVANLGGNGTPNSVNCPINGNGSDWISISPLAPSTASADSGSRTFVVTYNPTALQMQDLSFLNLSTSGKRPECIATVTFSSPGAVATQSVRIHMGIMSRFFMTQTFPGPNPIPQALTSTTALDSFRYDNPVNFGISKTLAVTGDGALIPYTVTLTGPFTELNGTPAATCPGTALVSTGPAGVPAADSLAPGGITPAVSSVVVTANSQGCTNGYATYTGPVTFTASAPYANLAAPVTQTVTMIIGNALTTTGAAPPTVSAIGTNVNTDSTSTLPVTSCPNLSSTCFNLAGVNYAAPPPQIGNATETAFNYNLSQVVIGSAGAGCPAPGSVTNFLDLPTVPGAGYYTATGNNVNPVGLTVDQTVWTTLPSGSNGCTYTALITVCTPGVTTTGCSNPPDGGFDPVYVMTPAASVNAATVGATNQFEFSITKVPAPISLYNFTGAGTLQSMSAAPPLSSPGNVAGVPTLIFPTAAVGAGILPPQTVQVSANNSGEWTTSVATSPGPANASPFTWPGACFVEGGVLNGLPNNQNNLVQDGTTVQPGVPQETLSGPPGTLPLPVIVGGYVDVPFANLCGEFGSLAFGTVTGSPSGGPPGSWLTATQTGGSGGTLTLTANNANLAPGIYTGYVAIIDGTTPTGLAADSGNQPFLLTTELVVSGITASSAALPFYYTVGQSTGAGAAATNPSTQTLTLSNAAVGTPLPNYTLTSSFAIPGIVPPACGGGVFATLTGTNSTNPGPAGLTDTYTITPASADCLNALGTTSLLGTITITSGVQTVTVSVPVTVVVPTLTILPSNGATFNYVIGQPTTTQMLTFTASSSPTGLPITATIFPAAPWLTTTVVGNQVTLNANPTGLTALGSPYTTTVTLSTPANGATGSIPVTFNVTAEPTITIGAPGGATAFSYNTSSTSGPAPQEFFVSVSGALAIPLASTVSPGASWLTANLSTTSPTLSGILFVSVDPTGLLPSTTPYTGVITVSSPGVPQATLTVNLTVSSPAKATEAGIFRGGNQFLLDTANNQTVGAFYINFVTPVAGDIPVSGDWSGSGTSKIGIYRPTTGTWFLDYNGDGTFDAGDKTYQFGGIAGDLPVVGDWSGTGTAKIGIFRSGFFWLLDYNGDGAFDAGDQAFGYGGITGDVPVAGDWTGDGKAKVGVVRPFFPGGAPAFWILDANNDHSIDAGDLIFAYGGINGDLPVVGDWDGSGTAKAGIFRSGFFWIEDFNGSAPTTLGGTDTRAFAFGGIAGDVPIPGKWQ